MSWSISEPCYECWRLENGCQDVQKIKEAIKEIHQDPDHVKLGGSGSVTVTCSKKVTKFAVETAVAQYLEQNPPVRGLNFG